MPEADVLYSDVKFITSRDKSNGEACPSEDTTYSEVKIAKTSQPSTERTDTQQAESKSRSSLTLERLAVVVLIVLLVAAATALGYTTYKMMQTTEHLRGLHEERQNLIAQANMSKSSFTKLKDELEALKKNFTEQRKCETQRCITVKPTCWTNEMCKKCEADWEQFGEECYYFSSNKSSWSQSRSECEYKGGDLVKIDSRNEQEFLDQTVRGKMEEDEDKFWIGLTDSEDEGSWLWVDNTPLNSRLKFWSRGEPDNWRNNPKIEEDCGRMGERGGAENFESWFDQSCDEKNKYICEKHAENGKKQCV